MIHKQKIYGHDKIIERRHIVSEKLSFCLVFTKNFCITFLAND